MRLGQEKNAKVSSEEGYGRIDPNAFQEILRSVLSANIKLKVGMSLQIRDFVGKVMPAKISEIKKNSIILGLNHSLADRRLPLR